MLIPARTRPVSLEIDIPTVTIACQSIDLASPIDIAFTEWAPERLVAFESAVLGVNMYDAIGGKQPVSSRKGIFARNIGIGRIPYHFKRRMIDLVEYPARLRGCRYIACVLVLKADDQILFRRQIGKIAEGLDHAIEHRRRVDCSPVTENSNDSGPRSMRDRKRPPGQPRLIFERMGGCKDVLLETRIRFRRIG